jgi:hypothetical protein
MQAPTHHGQFPNLDRLSFLSAVVLLAYALARMVNLPKRFEIQLPGIILAPRICLLLVSLQLLLSLVLNGCSKIILR